MIRIPDRRLTPYGPAGFFNLITGHIEDAVGARKRFKSPEHFEKVLTAACRHFRVAYIDADMECCEDMSQRQLTVLVGVLGIEERERGRLAVALQAEQEDIEPEEEIKSEIQDTETTLTSEAVKAFADQQPEVDANARAALARTHLAKARENRIKPSLPTPSTKTRPDRSKSGTFRERSTKPPKPLTARQKLFAGVPRGGFHAISEMLHFLEEKKPLVGHPAGFLLTLLTGNEVGVVPLSTEVLVEKMGELGHEWNEKKAFKLRGPGEKGCNIMVPEQAEAIMDMVVAEATAKGIELTMTPADRAKCIEILNIQSNKVMWDAAKEAQAAADGAHQEETNGRLL